MMSKNSIGLYDIIQDVLQSQPSELENQISLLFIITKNIKFHYKNPTFNFQENKNNKKI